MLTQTETPQITDLYRLLLNAWCAEYALHISFRNTDAEFLNESLNWTFPQAYYAALFSARAVLRVDDICIANPEKIERLMRKWAWGGSYGPSFANNNPFGDLLQYSFANKNPPQTLSAIEGAAMVIKLSDMVHKIGLVHETYILKRLGPETFRSFIVRLPEFLQRSFIGARANLLLSDF